MSGRVRYHSPAVPKIYDGLKNARHGRERELEMVIVASLKIKESCKGKKAPKEMKMGNR